MSCASGRLFRLTNLAACCALLALLSGSANAATVLSVGTVDLVANSDFIFHGKVIARRVAAGPQGGSIITYLQFSVADVLKGAAGRQTVELGFLGGTLNGRTLRIAGMKLPAIGEEGVFFVERLGRNQVHPLYGWDQGRFLVREDAKGRKLVFTHDLQPVSGIDSVRAAPGVGAGRAIGVGVADDERDVMSLDAFKLRIRDLLEAL